MHNTDYSFVQQAQQFEDSALRRWGPYCHDESQDYASPRLRTSFAREINRDWEPWIEEFAPHPARTALQREVRGAFACMQQWARSPGKWLAPWAAERFWLTQAELAELLTAIRSETIPQCPPSNLLRNAWFATPGQILAEMKTTKAVINDLAQSIFDRYRRPYLDAHDAAFEEFLRQHGRHAGVPNYDAGETTLSDEQKQRDMQEILDRIAEKTGFRTTHAHLSAKTYEPAFVKSWDRFYMEWDNWFAGNKNWTARMWGGAWEKAIEYRKRANQWRARFEALDPKRNKLPSPKPTIPENSWEELGSDVQRWFKWGVTAVAALAIVPPILSALRRNE